MRLASAATFALTFALLPAQEQDRLTLDNGDFFAGRVLALEDGLIKFESPHSTAPLSIINEGLAQLSFANQGDSGDTADSLPLNSQEIILKNGDRFPGELTTLDQEQINFKTWFTGDLLIPRNQIDSVLFGVTPQTSVYRGPESLEGWDQENSRNWSFEEDKLVARQRSSIGRSFDLPGNFIFRSKISWSNSPNCRIHLCGSETDLEDKTTGDSYVVTLSSSGVQIQRIILNADDNATYQQLLNNPVSLRSRNIKSVDLEIHINRGNRMIHLFLDGEKVGQGVDPNEAPFGNCLVFENQHYSSGDMTVSDISIDEWDTQARTLRLEPRAGDEFDTLSVEDGDRFSGEIIGYDPTESNESFSIKTGLTPNPITIPLPHCSVIYFSSSDELPEASGRYQINLRVGGSLTVSKIKLGPESLTAIHPWLGELKIDRRAMKSITKG